MTDNATLRARIEGGIYGDPALSGRETSEAIAALDALLDRIAALEEALATAVEALTAISEMSDATEQSSFREEAWAALDKLEASDDRPKPGDNRGDGTGSPLR